MTATHIRFGRIQEILRSTHYWFLSYLNIIPPISKFSIFSVFWSFDFERTALFDFRIFRNWNLSFERPWVRYIKYKWWNNEICIDFGNFFLKVSRLGCCWSKWNARPRYVYIFIFYKNSSICIFWIFPMIDFSSFPRLSSLE
jgi:hypothetical protein